MANNEPTSILKVIQELKIQNDTLREKVNALDREVQRQKINVIILSLSIIINAVTLFIHC